MKHLGIFILGALLLASCATNKRAAYIQQVQTDIPTAIEQDYQIRIKPLDRLTVTINSKDPELAAPFNAASSYNSLNGLSSYSSSSNGNLQILTVDKEGKIQLPIIGEIDCDGHSVSFPKPTQRSKTRSAKTGWCTTRSSSSNSPT